LQKNQLQIIERSDVNWLVMIDRLLSNDFGLPINEKLINFTKSEKLTLLLI